MKKDNTAQQKHRAIILLKVEIHSVSAANECTGHLVDRSEMEKFKIQPKKIYSIDGFDRTDCLKKLKHIVEQLNDA